MGCDGTCSTGMSRITTPFSGGGNTGRSKVADSGYLNCQDGGVLTFASVFDVLDTADGASFTVAVSAQGGPAGDFIRLLPFGSDKMYLHSLQAQVLGTVAAGVFTPLADVFENGDGFQVATGEIRLNGKEVRPTMNGSFLDHVVPLGVQNCENFQRCGIFGQNGCCLPIFDADNPMDIALANLGIVAAPDTVRIAVEVQLEYAHHREWRKKNGIPLVATAAVPAGYVPVG